ncbi:TNF receptor-associated factor family DDB_G0272829-like [Paramuricea clavata]|uniref:TNF receptor-associated factor family DDB_G0272829-like n=1 Tax=Paramuricea clavata TaxID=317549 RepID=A0A6S7FKI7_PARCT|nr:TNF receptor-associated factor family DDB_G0272829-like [Paramuricea clavata]
MAENNNDLGSSFIHNFSCKICLKILHDPVQCQNNEHHFCRGCITGHLGNSETCPLCMEQLTLETLRPPSRIVASVVSQLKKPRCSHVSRGCEENVQVEELLLHEQTCGYAPVVCSNEGCKETVNRRDKESHETEECKFRKITCESCDEELVYVDFEKHQCTLRKEMNEVKSRLDEMSDALNKVVLTQSEMLEKQKAHDQSIKDLQNPLRHFSSATIQRDSAVNIKGQIFIFSGKSLEVFNWSTKAWTLIENCLFFSHSKSFSFLYEKRIMLCNGRIEFLDPSENGFTSNLFPASLPSGDLNGVLFKNRIITFGFHVQETSLERPWESTVLIQGPAQYYGSYGHTAHNNRSKCALGCFGNTIFVIGFSGNRIERYDIASNELTTLTTLPYTVYNMATVAYKDNIIILGGSSHQDDHYCRPLNDVLMYNIHSLECKRLPSMLERRSGCAAVILGDVIVVMGGEAKGTNYTTQPLKTVEYYVIGDTTWRELPAMNQARAKATACVYE